MQASLPAPVVRASPWRAVLVGLMAAAPAISVAAISLVKAVIVLVTLALILLARKDMTSRQPLRGLLSPWLIVLALLAFGASLLWTVESMPLALQAFSKHGKLLLIPLLVLLIRSPAEARIGLACYAAAEIFVLLSSYAITAGYVAPWVPEVRAANAASVFSSYLDESIMAACFAAMCWHLRDHWPWRGATWVAAAIGVAVLVNVFYILPGRTGQVVALTMLTLAAWYALPRRMRWAVVLVPVLVAGVLVASSKSFQTRLGEVVQDTKAYSTVADNTTSSGLRLDFWRTSAGAILREPLHGYGVGSWNFEYLRLSKYKIPASERNVRNPHQEYLLWGVELGVPGILLLLAVLGSVLRDSLNLPTPIRHALQSVLAGGAVACLFNSTLFDAVIGDYFCVLWGLLLGYGRSLAPPPGQASA